MKVTKFEQQFFTKFNTDLFEHRGSGTFETVRYYLRRTLHIIYVEDDFFRNFINNTYL